MASLIPFDYQDYKAFLQAWIKAQPFAGHGSKAALARAAECQTSYISQVVLGEAHLSLEQAEKIATHVGLGESETQFFLLVLQKDRAGTPRLRAIFQKQIDLVLQKRLQLKSRVDAKTKASVEVQSRYFSSWIYSAVHLLCTIPEYKNREAIAKHLALPLAVINEAIDFLIESRFISVNERGQFVAGLSRMHLAHDSPIVSKHHINWRLRAIRDLEIQNNESLHYSSAIAISKKDAKLFREQMMQTIESIKKKTVTSKEEKVVSFCLDFFDI